MNLDKYPVKASDEYRLYEFLSEGPNGTIKKVVHYQEIGKNLFNLAFGDWDEEIQAMNDKIRSNNNDRDKILATVASTVIDFMNNYPQATIYAEGTTPAKTRLHQMGINQNWSEIILLFEVRGLYDDLWENFRKSKNYEAFLIKRK